MPVRRWASRSVLYCFASLPKPSEATDQPVRPCLWESEQNVIPRRGPMWAGLKFRATGWRAQGHGLESSYPPHTPASWAWQYRERVRKYRESVGKGQGGIAHHGGDFGNRSSLGVFRPLPQDLTLHLRPLHLLPPAS